MRVQGVGAQVGRPHVIGSQQHVGGDVGDHRQHAEHADDRPAQEHHQGKPEQHEEGGAQHQGQGVGGLIVAPHGPADLAHGSAGEGVGVPVGGEGLHAREGVVDHLFHVVGGERVPEPQLDVAGDGVAQEHADEERPGPPGAGRMGRILGHGVDKAAGGLRQHQVQADGDEQEDQGGDEQPGPPHPLPDDESQHLAVAQHAAADAVVGNLGIVAHRRRSRFARPAGRRRRLRAYGEKQVWRDEPVPQGRHRHWEVLGSARGFRRQSRAFDLVEPAGYAGAKGG